MWTRIKKVLKEQESRIILVLGLILVSAASFAAGYLKGQENTTAPIVIEKPAESQKIAPERVAAAEPKENGSDSQILTNSQKSVVAEKKECQYVGSKNSDKFHLPTCQWAKRIKPENLVCYESIEAAEKQGKIRDKCVK